MAGFTNKGKFRALEDFARSGDTVRLPLYTSAVAPSADTNTNADLTQIAAGNGYTDGGPSIVLNGTNVDVLVEDDTNDRAYAQLADVVYTASGGSIPGSGSGARYFGLTDNGGTVSAREVFMYWSLTSDRTVSDGQTLTIVNAEFRYNEA